MQAVRILGAVLGGLLVLWTSSSVLETLVTPGVQVERLYRTVYLTIDQPFRWLSYLVPDYRRRYRFMVFQAPLTLVVGLFSYNGGLYWGVNGDWEELPDLHDFLVALEESFAELQRAAGTGPESMAKPEARERA